MLAATTGLLAGFLAGFPAGCPRFRYFFMHPNSTIVIRSAITSSVVSFISHKTSCSCTFSVVVVLGFSVVVVTVTGQQPLTPHANCTEFIVRLSLREYCSSVSRYTVVTVVWTLLLFYARLFIFISLAATFFTTDFMW